MGAWSHEPFGNDTAADWAYALLATGDLSYIEATLEAALAYEHEYLPIPQAEQAIAAVEVLAKLLDQGTQYDDYTAGVDAWVASIRDPIPHALFRKAQRVIERIVDERSELRELWEASDQADDWRATVAALHVAMGAVGRPQQGR